MESIIASVFIGRSAWSRAELIGRAPEYINDDRFINMLNSLDINEMNPGAVRRSCYQFAAFNGVPELNVQVRRWLNS